MGLKIMIGCLLLILPTQGRRMNVNRVSETDTAAGRPSGCKISDTITCPKWLCARVLGIFFDVELFCHFPREEVVFEQIESDEKRIISLSSTALLKPSIAAGSDQIGVWELQDGVTEDDLIEKSAEIGSHDMLPLLASLKQQHSDTCAGNSKFPPAESADKIFANIKSLVDEFDIFTKCTKTYVKRKDVVTGRPQLMKDDVVAISTELAAGMFALSYEDVSQYDEYTVLEDGKAKRILTMIVSSRKENVIEGNYDIKVRVEDDELVRVEYRKRQNLAEAMLRKGITHDAYAITTQLSIDSTIRKLAYVGVYGRDAIAEGGCYEDPGAIKWGCAEYGSLQSGSPCEHDMQCESIKCLRSSKTCK